MADIARLGVVIDPSGAVTGADAIKKALATTKEEANKAAREIAALKMRPGGDLTAAFGLQSQKYAEATAAAKLYAKGIEAIEVEASQAARATQGLQLLSAPQGLTEWQQRLEHLNKQIEIATVEVAELASVKMPGGNPALVEMQSQLRVLKQEAGTVAAVIKTITPPPPIIDPADKQEAKALLSEMKALERQLQQLETTSSKGLTKGLSGDGIKDQEKKVDNVIFTVGKLQERLNDVAAMGLKGFDISAADKQLSGIVTKTLQLTHELAALKNTDPPSFATALAEVTRLAGTAPSMATLKTSFAAAEAQAKQLKIQLAGAAAAGADMDSAPIRVVAKELEKAEKAAKVAARAVTEMGGQVKVQAQKISNMAIWGAFMGAREALKAPTAAVFGLSQGTQEVIDKIGAMGQAGFSMGQLLGTGFGLGAAAVFALVGAVTAYIGKQREAEKAVRDSMVAFDQLRSHAFAKGDSAPIEGMIGNTDKLLTKYKELNSYSSTNAGKWADQAFGGVAAATKEVWGALDELNIVVGDTQVEYEKLLTSADKAVVAIKDSGREKPLAELKKDLKEAEERYNVVRVKAAMYSTEMKALGDTVAEVGDGFYSLGVGTLGASKQMDGLVNKYKSGVITVLGFFKTQKDINKALAEFKAAQEALDQKGSGRSKTDPYDELIKKLKEANEVAALPIDGRAGAGEYKNLKLVQETLGHVIALKYQDRKTNEVERNTIDALVVSTQKLIKTEKEYQQAKAQTADMKKQIESQKDQLELLNFTAEAHTREAFAQKEVNKVLAEKRELTGEIITEIYDQADAYLAVNRAINITGLMRGYQDTLSISLKQLEISQMGGRETELGLRLFEKVNAAKKAGLTLTVQEYNKLKDITQTELQLESIKSRQDLYTDQIEGIKKLESEYRNLFHVTDMGYTGNNKTLEITNKLIGATEEELEQATKAVDSFAEASATAAKLMNDPFVQFYKTNEDGWDQLKQVGISSIEQLNAAWSTWLTTGEFSMRDFTTNALNSLQSVFTKVLEAKAIGAIVEKTSGSKLLDTLGLAGRKSGGGLAEAQAQKLAVLKAAEMTATAKATLALEGLAIAAGQAAVATAGDAAAGALGAVGAVVEGVGAATLHKGGYAGSGKTSLYPAGLFANASHFDRGGLASGDIPIIAHKNEGIVPLPDGRSIPVKLQGGGGGDIYNISVAVHLSGTADRNTIMMAKGEMRQAVLAAVNQAKRRY